MSLYPLAWWEYTHKFVVVTLLLSSPRHIVTCGHDCDVHSYVGLEDDEISEFSLSSSKLTALVCYTTPAGLDGGGADVVAVAMDDNTVQAFTTDVSRYRFYCTIADPIQTNYCEI